MDAGPAGRRFAAPDPTDIAALAAAHDIVQERIAGACARVGRDPAGVRLVAVSKTVPPDRIRAAVAAGLTVLGENRVQELETKVPLVPGATWHLIGPLQSNKARRAVEAADIIETVDSVELARRIDRLVREVRGLPPTGPVPAASRIRVLVQANVDDDPAKAGFEPTGLRASLGALLDLEALEVAGLMTVGRLVVEPEAARPTFRRLADLSTELRSIDPRLGPELSMGMTVDYPVAVEEGATIVRVGRALFGERAAA